MALADGDIRVYNGKNLVSSQKLSNYSPADPICGLYFGQMGREGNSLIVTTKGGSIHARILARHANLEASGSGTGPPPEQDIPLNAPKKTRLYVEQQEREREQAVDLHRIFQRDLCKLRLSTARAYVRVLTDGQGTCP